MTYTLYGAPGGGSMIVEAAFAYAGMTPAFVDLTWEQVGPRKGDPALLALNPLGQIPTLVLPDGTVMTESAAIVLYLADLQPDAGLAPPPGHPARPAFLRWLHFLVCAVYPTFTYSDDAGRWVEDDKAAAERLYRATEAHRQRLWHYLEQQAGEPWLLGETWSALDLYLWVMTWWRPGREWFGTHCPGLHRLALAMDGQPHCRAVLARNGLPESGPPAP